MRPFDVETRRLVVGCDFTYEAAVPTPAIFQVQPHASPRVTVQSESWASTPDMALRSYVDVYGNPCTRVVLPVGTSSFRYTADVEVPDAVEDIDSDAREIPPDELPDATLIFTLPEGNGQELFILLFQGMKLLEKLPVWEIRLRNLRLAILLE